MACFADTNVSQGSVATYARCGGIFNSITREFYSEILFKSVKIWQNYGNECGATFSAHSVHVIDARQRHDLSARELGRIVLSQFVRCEHSPIVQHMPWTEA